MGQHPMTPSPPLDPDAMPEWLASLFAAEPPVLAGPGMDDCGVVNTPAGCLVVSTDFVNAQPILLELEVGGLEELGRILVASNLSDLCGSGARPIAVLTGVMCEYTATHADFKSIIAGVQCEARRWQVPVLGGDTKLGARRAIYGVAIGYSPDAERLFLRYQAVAGDGVWLSGPVGDCAASITALSQPGAVDEETRKWARTAIVEPQLPMAMSQRAFELGGVHAGTDISDGLAADLLSVCRSSGVAIELEASSIPVSQEVRKVADDNGFPPWAFGLVLGGDFQFAITAPDWMSDSLRGIGFLRVGQVTNNGKSTLRVGAKRVPLPDLGHRDGRRRSFGEELQLLLAEVSELA